MALFLNRDGGQDEIRVGAVVAFVHAITTLGGDFAQGELFRITQIDEARNRVYFSREGSEGPLGGDFWELPINGTVFEVISPNSDEYYIPKQKPAKKAAGLFKLGQCVSAFGTLGRVTAISDDERVFVEFENSYEEELAFHKDGKLEPWHPYPVLKVLGKKESA